MSKELQTTSVEAQKQKNESMRAKIHEKIIEAIEIENESCGLMDLVHDVKIQKTIINTTEYRCINKVYKGVKCVELRKFAQQLNNNNEYDPKIRYQDSNMMLPTSVSIPTSCRLYFDWNPTLYDRVRYGFDDLIGKFGL